MDITKSGAKPAVDGPESWFTGAVKINAPFQATEPARVGGATVSFQPGARTAWHTHPLGQTLIVLEGEGLVQEWGKAAQVITTGDIVWIRPGVKHWHGAAASSAMTHLAIAESLDGKAVDWLEHVSDEQYQQ
ncbi:cupin domain-containing protein [Erwiniaceae bacterium BAC15a-03b]|uniref:Cupin domain-containing protein n=1 Tax=Winslowiella arboricola TaxID=2978220 RepID=A0A9J6PKI4_9GAMM|nr:cupin domain-containing protein [Winslowiella arboricola]MCU5774088.1 cupin domain-containing protein [Winslowiella arboricola]MCU5776979.1 cupin domain-containing protein [Winslowiella arboricola]